MKQELIEGDKIPLPCSHCTSPVLVVTIKEGSWVRECPKCKKHTVIKIERRTGRWEIHAGKVRGGFGSGGSK